MERCGEPFLIRTNDGVLVLGKLFWPLPTIAIVKHPPSGTNAHTHARSTCSSRDEAPARVSFREWRSQSTHTRTHAGLLYSIKGRVPQLIAAIERVFPTSFEVWGGWLVVI